MLLDTPVHNIFVSLWCPVIIILWPLKIFLASGPGGGKGIQSLAEQWLCRAIIALINLACSGQTSHIYPFSLTIDNALCRMLTVRFALQPAWKTTPVNRVWTGGYGASVRGLNLVALTVTFLRILVRYRSTKVYTVLAAGASCYGFRFVFQAGFNIYLQASAFGETVSVNQIKAVVIYRYCIDYQTGVIWVVLVNVAAKENAWKGSAQRFFSCLVWW